MRVATPDGLCALRLLGNAAGPVIEDQAKGTLCWLVAVGAADTWRLAGVRILVRGDQLAVPPAAWTQGPATRWRVPPRGTCLSEPRPLHDALAVATSERPRPIECFRSPECHMDHHLVCTKAEAPPSPPDIPVIYQACDCWCHDYRRRWRRRQEEAR
ncbi:hypothetical protein RM780_15585 [Streptomyces sp. DSM 44917]|uniref:Uncharacterized protein n=1 Tax=Streptomyces boetiae TaxID=3075541 RepID=A0ABU2L9X2_9ACTN|nr:hypothetical protein [Streptomyces sp. DSM 44917]MDT0308372.1 hypothetical protein [Streptomyces sp. DSM 44917]